MTAVHNIHDPAVPNTLRMHQFACLQPGPRLIVLGAVHGNEVCGSQAMERLRAQLESGDLRLLRGTLTLVPIVNPLAHRLQRRHGDRNLNRNLRITDEPHDYEDHVANVLCPWLGQHDVLLDLHSFQNPGVPFALFGPRDNQGDVEPFARARMEEALALRLGVSRFVEGWLQTYAQGVRDRIARGVESHVDYGVGTTETMRRRGGIAVTLECGQHEEATAPGVAFQAILNTLMHLGMIEGPEPTPCPEPEVICLYKVIDRHHPDDAFVQEWRSFQTITAGQLLAHRHDGSELRAECDGWIVFPNPKSQVNQEWYYLARASDRLQTNKA